MVAKVPVAVVAVSVASCAGGRRCGGGRKTREHEMIQVLLILGDGFALRPIVARKAYKVCCPVTVVHITEDWSPGTSSNWRGKSCLNCASALWQQSHIAPEA